MNPFSLLLRDLHFDFPPIFSGYAFPSSSHLWLVSLFQTLKLGSPRLNPRSYSLLTPHTIREYVVGVPVNSFPLGLYLELGLLGHMVTLYLTFFFF